MQFQKHLDIVRRRNRSYMFKQLLWLLNSSFLNFQQFPFIMALCFKNSILQAILQISLILNSMLFIILEHPTFQCENCKYRKLASFKPTMEAVKPFTLIIGFCILNWIVHLHSVKFSILFTHKICLSDAWAYCWALVRHV